MDRLEYYEADEVVEKYAAVGRAGLRPNERVLLDEYVTDPDGRVLDLGCGSGRVTAPLAERGFDVVGVNVSETMVQVARELHPDVEFRVGDATALSFPDGSFDYVLFADRGIDDVRPAASRMRAILESWRVLKPGGLFAFDANNQLSRFVVDPTDRSAVADTARFLARNLRAGTLRSRYAFVEYANGIDRTYAIVPPAQRRQLTDVGFELVGMVPSADDRRPTLLDPRPYYVARKPRRAAADTGVSD
ncbi:class I SAM-dependent methyltransferase [Haloarchaeobius salinus]|uniref:class I SAM-dependent methyltransferase n=1 Tax=Haloarchaeobius salinus TaxID=1198298 RepID=UPI00210AFE7F|nr:class I SAM-dependent methyltransferase [Haloarchaeobius salinus]